MEGKDFGKLAATWVRSLVSLTEKGLEVEPSRVERASVPKR
jgi:endonuclease YncB( thermonuclease family)